MRAWQPVPVFLPGESLRTEEPGGLQSMDCKEFNMTEQLSTAVKLEKKKNTDRDFCIWLTVEQVIWQRLTKF